MISRRVLKMVVTSQPLDEIRHLRVTTTNPETSSNDHIDFERCAAPHNAIVKHALISTGRDPNNLPVRLPWPPSNDAILQERQECLHPDAIGFLECTIDLEEGSSFVVMDAGRWTCSGDLETGGFGERRVVQATNGEIHLIATVRAWIPTASISKYQHGSLASVHAKILGHINRLPN